MAVSRFGPPDCPVCHGKECLGGGKLRCVQRNKKPSILAGILDTYGGLRFVVTHRRDLKYHVRHDEVAIVVPNLIVHEPIAWNDIPMVVARIELTVEQWIKRGMPNEPHAQEAVTMYRLRQLEHPHVKSSLNLEAIAYT